MHYFSYKKDALYCEDAPLSRIVKKYGTPLYVYSRRTLTEHFDKIREAFAMVQPIICYSVKANSNIALLKLLISRGSGLDIVSGGELFRARLAGCPPKKIVYASVGKTESEIAEAMRCGILLFNAESVPELERINAVAGQMRKRQEVALRVNPDVDARTHRYITTGKKETKFGIDSKTAKNIFLSAGKKYPHLRINGIHIHIGSQITEPEPFIEAIKKMAAFIKELARAGAALSYFDIGGGLGIIYDDEKPQTAQEFAAHVLPLIKQTGLQVILEPGRFIVGNAGILVSRVLYVKESYKKQFVIVDAAMNDLLRPSLYGSYHKIVPLAQAAAARYRKFAGSKKVDVVGPICESGDFFGKDRFLDVQTGDFIAVLSAGAYGFSMSSNYNSRPRAAEILVDGAKTYVIREREEYQDLVRKEKFAFL